MAKTNYNVILWVDTTVGWATDTKIYGSNDLLFDTDLGTYKMGNGVDSVGDLSVIATAATWGDITGKPAVIASGATAAAAWGVIQSGAIGTTAATAAAGNHDHAIVADAASGLAAAADLQALAIALSARIKVLEDLA